MGLNREIEHEDLFFPVDPGPDSSIGGMIATSCSGTNAVRYGTMRDWVISVTVVLADGRCIRTRRRPRKSSAGFNLTSLFVGSEGTLGFVVEAVLRLAVLPEETSVATVPFPSVHDAASAAIRVLRAGIPIGAIEMMDERLMRSVNTTLPSEQWWEESPTLFVKFVGTHAAVEEQIQRVDELTQGRRSGPFRFAFNEKQASDMWAVRKNALPTILSHRDADHEMYSTDLAVPLSRLPAMVADSRQLADRLGLESYAVAHVSF